MCDNFLAIIVFFLNYRVLIWNPKYSQLNVKFFVLKNIFLVKLLNSFENKLLYDNKFEVS